MEALMDAKRIEELGRSAEECLELARRYGPHPRAVEIATRDQADWFDAWTECVQSAGSEVRHG
jgi:hypothetical protein